MYSFSLSLGCLKRLRKRVQTSVPRKKYAFTVVVDNISSPLFASEMPTPLSTDFLAEYLRSRAMSANNNPHNPTGFSHLIGVAVSVKPFNRNNMLRLLSDSLCNIQGYPTDGRPGFFSIFFSIADCESIPNTTLKRLWPLHSPSTPSLGCLANKSFPSS